MGQPLVWKDKNTLEEDTWQRAQALAAQVPGPLYRSVGEDAWEGILAVAGDGVGGSPAWVEGQLRDGGRLIEAKYTLCMRPPVGAEWRWPIATYNPAFGCTPLHLSVHDGRAVVIYQEKHELIIASVGGPGDARMRALEGELAFDGPWVSWRDPAFGLIHGVHLPSLEVAWPRPEVLALQAPLRRPSGAVISPEELWTELLGSAPPEPEAGILWGSLALPFLQAPPEPASTYDFPVSLGAVPWLPFAWWSRLPTSDAKAAFLALLDTLAARQSEGAPVEGGAVTPLSLGAAQVRLGCARLAAACRGGCLPEGAQAHLEYGGVVAWVGERLGDYPPGFRIAWSQLTRG